MIFEDICKSDRKVEVRYKSSRFNLNYYDVFKLGKRTLTIIVVLACLQYLGMTNTESLTTALSLILVESIQKLLKGEV